MPAGRQCWGARGRASTKCLTRVTARRGDCVRDELLRARGTGEGRENPKLPPASSSSCTTLNTTRSARTVDDHRAHVALHVSGRGAEELIPWSLVARNKWDSIRREGGVVPSGLAIGTGQPIHKISAISALSCATVQAGRRLVRADLGQGPDAPWRERVVDPWVASEGAAHRGSL